MDIIQEAKEYLKHHESKRRADLTNLPLDLISHLIDRLEAIHDVCDFNEYTPIVVSGLLDQNSFDKGYKSAMYQIYKIIKPLPPVGDK